MDRFTDYMVKDVKTGECYRADHLLKGTNTLYCTMLFSTTTIDHNEKDGGMYILPECIASIKSK